MIQPPAAPSRIRSLLTGALFWVGILLAVMSSIIAFARPDFIALVGAIIAGGLSRLIALLLVFAGGCLLAAARWSDARWHRRSALATMLLLVPAAIVTLWYEVGAYSRQRVLFTSDGVELIGTLFRPRGSGPFPAVVIVPGSGTPTRKPYDLIADRLARLGFVVLNPDKRGVGDSKGNFADVSNTAPQQLAQRARDVIAAVHALTQRPDVRPTQIGLWTVSQGGWVSPLAAQETSEIAFLVVVSGPTVSVGEEKTFSLLTNDEADHFGYRPPPISLDEAEGRAALTGPSGFDPDSALQQLQVPSLWLFGAWDNSLPVKRSVARLERLRGAGQPITIRVFPEANHGLLIARGPHKRALPYYAPGVWSTMSSWLQATTFRSTQ